MLKNLRCDTHASAHEEEEEMGKEEEVGKEEEDISKASTLRLRELNNTHRTHTMRIEINIV